MFRANYGKELKRYNAESKIIQAAIKTENIKRISCIESIVLRCEDGG